MAQPAEEASVLLVDDHQVFVDVLAMRLRAQPGVGEVAVAHSLAQALSLVVTMQPQLMLVDYQLADECGVTLLNALDGLGCSAEVIMVSGRSDAPSIVAALRAGARGWVLKDEAFEGLLEAIERVRNGQLHLSGTFARAVALQLLDESTDRERTPDFLDQISPRELAVLRGLVSGLTRDEVAERLYVSPNTVRTHIHKLLRVTGLHSTLALIAAARRSGVPEYEDLPRPELPLGSR